MRRLYFLMILVAVLILPLFAQVAIAQVEGIPPEVVEFLTPWAYLPAVGIIVTLAQLFKGFADFGKLHWVWCFIFSGIFAVGQKFLFPMFGLPPLQTEWGYVALIFLGTGLVAVGTYSVQKNTREGLS